MPSLERPRIENKTPEDLVRDVKRGLVRVPQFQRNFKWEATDIVKLFDSVLQGYPIGNLLLWQRHAPAEHVEIGPLSVDAPATEAALWVVDGQQRITSLVGALTSAETATDSRFRVHFALEDSSFHTIGPRQAPVPTWIPVSLLLDTASLLRWMRVNSEWLTESQLELADQASKALREYQIPTYIVIAADVEPLLEIFTRMNTTGKRLTKSEVFHALNSADDGDDYSTLAAIGRIPTEVGFGVLDDRVVLRSVLAYIGGDVYREDFRDEFGSPEERDEVFKGVALAIRSVVRFLQRDAGIPHIKLLPYSHVIPILVRFVQCHGEPTGRVATLLRRWVWRSAIAGTHARGVSVAEVREQVRDAAVKDPINAAQHLLDRIHPFPVFVPDLDKFYFAQSVTKINVLGLLAAGPLDLWSENPVAITPLLEDGTPLRPIVAGGPATIANRIIIATGSPTAIRSALLGASREVASSHLVTVSAQAMLQRGDDTQFLRTREHHVRRRIQMHVDAMTEWGARDGESMSNLLKATP